VGGPGVHRRSRLSAEGRDTEDAAPEVGGSACAGEPRGAVAAGRTVAVGADSADPNIAKHEGDDSPPIPSAVSIIMGWTMLLAEERPLTATLPRSAMAQLGLLQVHHRWIAAQPFVDDYLNEMVGLRKALSAALRDHTHKQVGRCRLPVEGREGPCGGALIEENGTDTIKCQDCHAQWSEPHERARLAMSLESA
jgi:hypothetical protein